MDWRRMRTQRRLARRGVASGRGERSPV